MWNAEDKMDDDKRVKMVGKLKAMGIAEDKIDNNILWAAKKIHHKVNKMRMYLDEVGISEPKAKEIVNKLVAEALEKDLAKIKEWHKEHDFNNSSCCMHCDMCHHMGAEHVM